MSKPRNFTFQEIQQTYTDLRKSVAAMDEACSRRYVIRALLRRPKDEWDALSLQLDADCDPVRLAVQWPDMDAHDENRKAWERLLAVRAVLDRWEAGDIPHLPPSTTTVEETDKMLAAYPTQRG